MHLILILLALFPLSHARAVDIISHLPAAPDSSDAYNSTTEFACNCLPAEDCPKHCTCCLHTQQYDRFLLYGGTFFNLLAD